LKTPLRRSSPELDRHAWLESADAYAYDRGSMEESIAGPVRELDEAVPLSRIEPFQFTPNRRRGRLTELCFGKLRRDLGMAQRVAVVRLLLRHDFAMARSAITVCFSDDLPSTLTNQSASLYDEIRYGFEHARLRKIDSRYSVSAGQLPRRGEKLPEATARKHAEADTRRVGGNRNREMSGTLCLLKSRAWFSISRVWRFRAMLLPSHQQHRRREANDDSRGNRPSEA
jgi:hypothetical protein